MKIGILGTGDISHAFMKALPTQYDVEVTSVYHCVLDKALYFAEQYQIPRAFDSVEELLSSGVDCVYIGLPNSLHYSTAMQCIQEGKHVLIEKPITSNLTELQTLLRFARQRHVYALEVNRVTFLSNYQFIRQMMPELGPKTLMHISYCKRSRRYDDYLDGKKPNVFSTDFSGGALYDLGVYGLHFVYGLLGSPESMEYRCLKLESGVDVMGVMTLTYPACIAVISISKVSGAPTNGVHIEGENGMITTEFPPSILKTVKFSKPHTNPQMKVEETDGFSAFLKNAFRIICEQDVSAYHQLSEESITVAGLMECARKQCGIVFAADISKD